MTPNGCGCVARSGRMTPGRRTRSRWRRGLRGTTQWSSSQSGRRVQGSQDSRKSAPVCTPTDVTQARWHIWKVGMSIEICGGRASGPHWYAQPRRGRASADTASSPLTRSCKTLSHSGRTSRSASSRLSARCGIGKDYDGRGLFRGLPEVAQVRRRLAFARRHQVAVAADEIIALADDDVVVVLGAIVLVPDHVADAAIAFVHRPRPREGMIDDRDLVVHDFRIGFIEADSLSHNRLVVLVERDAGELHRARAFEVAGFHLERVETAVPVGVQPFADRIAHEARLLVRRKTAAVRIDAARHEGF